MAAAIAEAQAAAVAATAVAAEAVFTGAPAAQDMAAVAASSKSKTI